ncbi:MAG: Rieske (2Fe-2S) protein [Gemmatimonadaceae bacterium]
MSADFPAASSPTPLACVSCNRRQFVSSSILLAVSGLLIDACGDGVIGASNSQILGAVDFTVTLAAYPALANVGGIARITGTHSPVAVARTGASTFLGLSLICPHQGTTVNINGSGFVCPNHGARFDNTGAWVQSQQRTSSLTRVPVTYDATAGTLKLG